MEAKYERSRTFLLKLIVIKSDNPDFEKFRQKLRDKLLKIRLKSIEEAFYPIRKLVSEQDRTHQDSSDSSCPWTSTWTVRTKMAPSCGGQGFMSSK